MIKVFHRRCDCGETVVGHIVKFNSMAEVNKWIDDAFEDWKEINGGKVWRRKRTPDRACIHSDIQHWFGCNPIVEGDFEYFDIFKSEKSWIENKWRYRGKFA